MNSSAYLRSRRSRGSDVALAAVFPAAGYADAAGGAVFDSAHSITSSAWARINGATVSPSASAVFRLTTSLNFEAC